ncbi:type II toxin-antitoxin system RelE/ParE family toxin [Actinomyces ruminis]|uniref:Type II toxin-antitoxin system RelE/ParE family toxin n=1 Tax=Actinomyces ruminis TaxID=1937003 RepID=A0ABX4MBH3_9ACTO|nr:type II toxin-antitoxin system RelE/ParE family toxin [Actinomyces ruminis]
MRAYVVRYLPRAQRDLVDAGLSVLEVSGDADAAARTVRGIVAAINSLSTMPSRHRVYTPSRSLSREYRYVRAGQHLAFYWVDDELATVTVARIVHARADANRHLADGPPQDALPTPLTVDQTSNAPIQSDTFTSCPDCLPRSPAPPQHTHPHGGPVAGADRAAVEASDGDGALHLAGEGHGDVGHARRDP